MIIVLMSPYGPDIRLVKFLAGRPAHSQGCGHKLSHERIAAVMIEACRAPTGASHSHGRGQCGEFFLNLCNSGSGPVVVVQLPAQTLMTLHRACIGEMVGMRLNQTVFESLVVAFLMVVRHELADRCQ